MNGIYSGPSYAMGADVIPAANTPITAAQAAQAKRELAAMRRSLIAWLKYRRINDADAAGQGATIPTPLLRRPGARPAPPEVVRMNLARWRSVDEPPMALHLYRLLSEVFDPQRLPSPDVSKNPNTAVDLAEIAIAGKLPGEAPAPTSTGFFWLWPAVIVVGAAALVLTTMIRSNADVAKEREKYECIRSGKCTDSGFWLKVGAVAVVGWLAWDKLGVREQVMKLKAGRRTSRAR